MEYNRIIAITGLGGLFELLSSRGDGAVVRSLEDKQTRFVSSRIHHFSHLESIEIYTIKENVNLIDLFKAIQASTIPPPPENDPDRVKGYFERVYPDMDFTRIYNSDMKKMIKWYNLLISNNIELKLPDPASKPTEAAAHPAEKKKAASSKASPPKKDAPPAKKDAPAPKKETASKGSPAAKKDAPAPKKGAPTPKKDLRSGPSGPSKSSGKSTGGKSKSK